MILKDDEKMLNRKKKKLFQNYFPSNDWQLWEMDMSSWKLEEKDEFIEKDFPMLQNSLSGDWQW